MLSRNVETFITVVELGSFAKAAERLYMSPVSVMNQMNALEDRTGLKLLERTNQGIFATPAGASLFQDAKQMMEFYEKAILRARRAEAPKKPLIRIGSSLMNPCNLLLDLWEKVPSEERIFNLSVKSFEDSSENMLDISRFLGSKIDLFVGPCGSTKWKHDYAVHILSKTKNMIGVPRTHPLATRDWLTLTDLAGETMIMPARGDAVLCDQQRDILQEKYPLIHLYDGPHYYSMEVFNECVEHGYLLHMHDIWTTIHPSIISLPVRDPDWIPAQDIGIVTTRQASTAVDDFIETILRMQKQLEEAGKEPHDTPHHPA